MNFTATEHETRHGRIVVERTGDKITFSNADGEHAHLSHALQKAKLRRSAVAWMAENARAQKGVKAYDLRLDGKQI